MCAVSTHMGTAWLLQWSLCCSCISSPSVHLILVMRFRVGGWELALGTLHAGSFTLLLGQLWRPYTPRLKCTKIRAELADVLAGAVVDSILTIKKTRWTYWPLNGWDHGYKLHQRSCFGQWAWNPDMRMRVEDAYILKCNVSLEYEGGGKRILAFSFFFFTRVQKRETSKNWRKLHWR